TSPYDGWRRGDRRILARASGGGSPFPRRVGRLGGADGRNKGCGESGAWHHLLDGEDHPAELFVLGGESLAAGGGHLVIAGAAVIFRCAPFGGDPTVEKKALQGGGERAFANVEHVRGNFLEVLGDAVAVTSVAGERAEDKHVESTR